MGIQWYNLRSSLVEGDSYNLSTSIIMLYVDAFIYAVAAWYIEAVFPGTTVFTTLNANFPFCKKQKKSCSFTHRVESGGCMALTFSYINIKNMLGDVRVG